MSTDRPSSKVLISFYLKDLIVVHKKTNTENTDLHLLVHLSLSPDEVRLGVARVIDNDLSNPGAALTATTTEVIKPEKCCCEYGAEDVQRSSNIEKTRNKEITAISSGAPSIDNNIDPFQFVKVQSVNPIHNAGKEC